MLLSGDVRAGVRCCRVSSETFAGMSALSKLLLSIYMIAGRLELYTMFILIFPRFWNPDH